MTKFIGWNNRENLNVYYLIIDLKTVAVLETTVPDYVKRQKDLLGNDHRHFVIRLGKVPEVELTNILNVFEAELKQMANTVFSVQILSREEAGTCEKELAIRLENSTDAGAERWRRLRESAIQKLEQIDKEDFELTFTPAAPAVSVPPAVPASVPVVSDSPAVLFVPEFDGSNDWIKISEMAQEMVDNEISIDIEAAKKHLRNMKSNGMKSAEKYDGKNSTYGEINISSFQVKWRMVRNGGKWNVYFYRPSLKWKQK